MSMKHVVFGLLALCAIVVGVSFAGVISDFVTHLLPNVDGLLLLMICALMAAIFLAMIYVLLKESNLLPHHHQKLATAPASGAAPVTSEGKPKQEQPAGSVR